MFYGFEKLFPWKRKDENGKDKNFLHSFVPWMEVRNKLVDKLVEADNDIIGALKTRLTNTRDMMTEFLDYFSCVESYLRIKKRLVGFGGELPKELRKVRRYIAKVLRLLREIEREKKFKFFQKRCQTKI